MGIEAVYIGLVRLAEGLYSVGFRWNREIILLLFRATRTVHPNLEDRMVEEVALIADFEVGSQSQIESSGRFHWRCSRR